MQSFVSPSLMGQQNMLSPQTPMQQPMMPSMQGVQPNNPPYYQPIYNYNPPPVQQPMLRVRPVTSKEEATATPVDFDGSVLILPDIAHGIIYTKVFNPADGSAIFNEYHKVNIVNPDAGVNNTPVPVITPDDIRGVESNLTKLIDDRLTAFESRVSGMISNISIPEPTPVPTPPPPAPAKTPATKSGASK